jgi:hypothetical protein
MYKKGNNTIPLNGLLMQKEIAAIQFKCQPISAKYFRLGMFGLPALLAV